MQAGWQRERLTAMTPSTSPNAAAPSGGHPATPPAGAPVDLWGLGDDDAIASTDQDKFGRARFAHHLTDVIRSAPDAASFRIGLYGEWGEGKTSVMALMEPKLPEEEFVCARVSAWDVQNATEVVRRVLAALARKAKLPPDESWRARFRRAGGRVEDVRKAAADAHWAARVLDMVAGDVLATKGREAAEAQLRKELDEARGALKGRRPVVFVDDLDRAPSAELPRVLMALREALPMPGLVFVLAISLRAVEQALERSTFGLETPARFLEKIVEFPTHLPPIPRAALEAYAVRRIGELPGLRRPESLRDMAALLPDNPRRLKLFLRTLAAFQRTFARFDDDEIDWRRVYLGQLLHVEFPDETRRLLADPKALGTLDDALSMELLRTTPGTRPVPMAAPALPDGPPSAAPSSPLEALAPKDGERRTRFLAICEQMRRPVLADDDYSLRDVLSLGFAPPVVTRQEVRALIAELRLMARTERGARLKAFAEDRGGATQVAAAVWATLLRLREHAIGRSRSALTPFEQGLADATSDGLTGIADAVVTGAGWFASGALGAKAWGRWFAQARPSGDLETPRQAAVRERALRLAGDMLQSAPASEVQDIYLKLEGARALRDFDNAPASFVAAVETLWVTAEGRLAEEALDRFRRPRGLMSYYGAATRDVALSMLLAPESRLYIGPASPDWMARFEVLADEAAAGNAVIAQNCFALLHEVARSANGSGGRLAQSQAAALLGNERLVRLLWRASSAGPWTDGQAEVLEAVRFVVLRASAAQSAWLPAPPWWSETVRARASEHEEEIARARADAV